MCRLTGLYDYDNMTIVMESISKSRFKAYALELFRQVERTGQGLIITDRGRPVLKLVPYREDPAGQLRVLRETVVRYDAPMDPVAEDGWEAVP